MSCGALQEFHVDDVGTMFKVTVFDDQEEHALDDNGIDLSGFDGMEFIFKKPDDLIITRVGSFFTNGTDGKIKYVTIDGDLDQAGLWTMQVRLTDGTSQWHTNKLTFRVYGNLE